MNIELQEFKSVPICVKQNEAKHVYTCVKAIILYAGQQVAEINPADPPNPSGKLTAFENPTVKKVAIGMCHTPRVNYSR